jgi:EmrB/QacA subfamily drug resistance transporter
MSSAMVEAVLSARGSPTASNQWVTSHVPHSPASSWDREVVTPRLRRARPTQTLVALVSAGFAYATLQTMVAPALPAIQHDLGASPATAAWVLTIYLLSASVATPVFGRLGDVLGKKRLLVCALLALNAGLLVAALAPNLWILVLGRAIQGASGAIFPLAIAIVRDEFPPTKVATGIGYISASFGIGGALGLPLSGVIIDHLSYHWIFWFGLFQSSIALVAVWAFVPASPAGSRVPIDWVGAGFLSAGLSLALLAVTEGASWGWLSPSLVALSVAAGIALLWWWRHEARTTHPLIDVRLLSRRRVWTTNLATLLLCVGMYGAFVLIPQLVQQPTSTGYGLGGTATEATLFLLPQALLMLVASPIAARAIDRFGPRLPVKVGLLLAAAAFALLTAAHSAAWQLLCASALMGAGFGCAYPALSHIIVEAVPRAHTGEASGVNAIMRTFGGALGAQIVASILSGTATANGVPTNAGFTRAFSLCTLALVGAVGAALISHGPRTTTGTGPTDDTFYAPEPATSGAVSISIPRDRPTL